MSRSAPAVLIAICVASVSGCSSSGPRQGQQNQIAKEGAERNALLEAAKEHPGLHGENDAVGKPLPPLPGVNAPSPKSTSPHENMSDMHDMHDMPEQNQH